MNGRVISIPTAKIVDWQSFHDVFKTTFGFPDFYGRNMDAWIDCMTSIDRAEHGMSAVTVCPGELLIMQIDDELKIRCPEQYIAIVECTSFVNRRRREVGESPVLALLLG
ncbi:MAG TPA: barstar family protein [Acidobacteriaceae bacterium]|nr:barstar family protein [Acidobacteriaceae bacterium]